ncbi:MAG: hypothetical protein QG597_4591 [Actinomycetota bacterium]|nr:hypothetical protein [Actinomycetota bacterium]
MCRLFGMSAGDRQVEAKFWLLNAPDSMVEEGGRNPDGAGIGWFDAGTEPHLQKQAGPAPQDQAFLTDAATVTASTVVTHVRDATAGSATVANAHPFLVDGLLVAHNGGFADPDAVMAQLGDYARFVQGDTDSERYAALIAKEAAARDGDIGAGILAAATWISQNVPMYSLNVVVIKDHRLWALRYPDERALHLARRVVRPATGAPDDSWSGSSQVAQHQVAANSETPIVVVASERIDGDDDWRMLQPGELVAVDDDLTITARLALRRTPARLLHLAGRDPNDEAF